MSEDRLATESLSSTGEMKVSISDFQEMWSSDEEEILSTIKLDNNFNSEDDSDLVDASKHLDAPAGKNHENYLPYNYFILFII